MARSGLRKEDFTFILIAAIFCFLIFFLYKVQVSNGSYYKKIAESNYRRSLQKPTKRGIIYDANLQPLVENIPSLSVYLDLRKMKDKEGVSEFLSNNLLLSKEKILKIIHKNRFIRFAPIPLAHNLDMETAIHLEENLETYPSLKVISESHRNYISQNHFVGYVGKISENEYEQLRGEGYGQMDFIGKVGLESFYENELRGSKGYDLLQVDASGTYLGLGKGNKFKAPQPGLDVVLSVDYALQEKINTLLPSDSSCVAIVMNCKTGGIIAAVSHPSYDQNFFVSGMERDYWEDIIQNPHNPLLNKVCNATYPPGSVFKLVTAAFALENEIVKPDEVLVDCEGGMDFGGRFFGCWKKEGHGKMDLLGAIRESCDTYFYELAKKIKLDEFKNFIQKCGILDKSKIDQFNKRHSFFPNTKWYNKHYSKHGWSTGNLLNLVIGQGEVLFTPLAVAQFYAGLANNGKVVTPHFADYLFKDGKKYKKIEYPSYKLPIKKKNISFLLHSLDKVVNGKHGTGQIARINGVKIGGKTGSAENYKGDTHAWFVAVAPIDDPEIVVVVFVENGGSGAGISAILTAKILAEYFETSTFYDL